MSDFLDLKFTTSITEVFVATDFDNNIQETKQTFRYCFDGDIMAVSARRIDSDRQPRSDVVMTLDGITGHNA